MRTHTYILMIAVMAVFALFVVACASQRQASSPSPAAPPPAQNAPSGGGSSTTANSSSASSGGDSSGGISNSNNTNVTQQQQQIINTVNQNIGSPVVVGGTAPVPGYVVVTPDVLDGDAQQQAALNAALTYYGKAEAGDYAGTYQMLSDGDKKHFSAEQWVHANKSLGTSSGRFVIHGIKRISPVAFDVYVTVYLADGSSFERTTHFIQDGSDWKHQLVQEETKMFDDAVKSP